MAFKASRHASNEGNVTYYADSESDVPFGKENQFRVGDTFICKTGTSGIVTYILFPSGWHKVG